MSAQPGQGQVYETSGNNASKNPVEERISSLHKSAASDGEVIATRSEHDRPTQMGQPTSLAQGIRAAPAGEEAKGLSEEDVGRHNELDAEQMAAPGEGKVAHAVERKSGATGAEPGLETDLERKKKEQAPLRDANMEARKVSVDVGGVLGQRGGPASSVD